MALTSSSSLRLNSTSSSSSSEFIQFTATMRLPIPPVFSTSSNGNQDPHADGGMEGVKEVLAGWVMRYLPPLHAVVLSFEPNPRFLHPEALFDVEACPFETLNDPSTLVKNPLLDLKTKTTTATNGKLSNGTTTVEELEEEEKRKLEAGELVRLKTLPMIDGSGFTLADVEWKGLGWRPQVGMKLVGTPTLSTSSHVSLLLHNLFNASIPSSHIPQDQFEFDPLCPVPSIVLERRQQQPKPQKSVEELEHAAKKAKREALGIEGDDDNEEDSDAEEDEKMQEEEEEEEEAFEEQGWWVDKKTRQPLGGSQGRVEFTLVALSTSNSLLSCTGSLLSDPFTPAALASLSDPSSSSSENNSSLALLQAQTIRSGHSQTQNGPLAADSDSDGDSSDSSDSEGEGEAASGDDDDGVGTGVPIHQGAPSKVEDPSKSDPDSSSDDSSDDSDSSSESGSEASSRSPTPEPEKEPVPETKGKKTKAEKKGKPPRVGKSKVETKVVVEEEEVVGAEEEKKKKKEKKRKEVESPEKGAERKSKKSRKA
ncbi:uncharacterized protein JCM6883_000355 [Sporobolomyces salmoneus]|uniref:uncharacterized protein n=1 Tax=Sporobolomyces salmoneus TaxID=183962 RepID=UPI00316D59F7